MQKSSQCSQITVPVTAWGQIFGKEYDAIKFVCGKSFGKGVGVRHVDDSETVIAIYGAFSFRYHHMVSGKGMLNPLLGNEIGITDQKHFMLPPHYHVWLAASMVGAGSPVLV